MADVLAAQGCALWPAEPGLSTARRELQLHATKLTFVPDIKKIEAQQAEEERARRLLDEPRISAMGLLNNVRPVRRR